MAKIRVSQFGGIAPSVDPRNLPPSGAQTAENLTLRYGDFRPVNGVGASVASVPSGTVSVHRTPSGTWLSSTSDANFVNNQVFDASAERVYATGHAAYPEAWEGGTYRRLGVPAPTSAPTTTASSTSQFSTDDRTAAIRAIVSGIYANAVTGRAEVPLGGGTPGSAISPGSLWLAHGANPDLPTTSWRQVCYCVRISSPTGPTVTASDSFMLDPTLGGKAIVQSALDYWAVPFTWQGRGYDLNETTLATYIRTVNAPPANTTQLWDNATCDEIAARVAAIFDPTVDPALTRAADVDAMQSTIVNLLGVGTVDPTRAFAVATASSQLTTNVRRLEDLYTTLNSTLQTLIGSIVDDYTSTITAGVSLAYETRGYIYTYVTDWGEESAPSPVSDLLTIDQNDGVGVTIAAPSVSSPYGTLTHWRLYRSSTTDASAAYQLVAEIAIGTHTYTDTKLQEELQETCPSLTWTEPRSDLFALYGMPNGILVGLANSGRTVCFSEPYKPYAWPREYEQTLEFPGVGVAGFGTTAVVPTTGQPYYVSGVDSANMSAQKMEFPQACVSKRSIVSCDGGVIYASPDGLCLASANGVELLTLGAYSKDDWQALGLSNSFGAFSEGVYYIVAQN